MSMHSEYPSPAQGLAPALTAPLIAHRDRAGRRLNYYADTSAPGRPLLLIHSINAAPSSFEVKPLFEHYRARRPVYSIDLPGFGQSERGRLPYSPEFFAAAIAEFLDLVGAAPTDVVALSLSSEFAARAALQVPARVASLTLISPTGFDRRPLPPAALGRILHAALAAPPWSQVLFDLVASRRSIRYYLSQSLRGAPPAAMLDYAHATSHRPGARHAPLAFLSSRLFTPRVRATLYARLTACPVLVIADRDPYVRFTELDAFIAARPNWRHERIAPHNGLPHWERLAPLTAALERFWEAPAPTG